MPSLVDKETEARHAKEIKEIFSDIAVRQENERIQEKAEESPCEINIVSGSGFAIECRPELICDDFFKIVDHNGHVVGRVKATLDASECPAKYHHMIMGMVRGTTLHLPHFMENEDIEIVEPRNNPYRSKIIPRENEKPTRRWWRFWG